MYLRTPLPDPTLPKTTGDVGEMLSTTLAVQKRTNGVAQNVRFFGRQGSPLHFTLIMVIPVTNAVTK